ncbi:2-oxo-4-hydroxy-4-carboxy-5-ureidoimidazoline decarboxylase [Paenibacillus psychroresistens]|uniref:2-oxo-4-hydroxy-4-carboxy-5-ureidoimidazoline decarboxylase n=1 Tax=Paenibacillus psychroresistens TaxID=1778678 RepID=A0A6B8RNM8_9BACL|nr:2-oxo-4-hydroxy-4-carboxy-5-ureidoimidazoline decarboxylase [Paenibacillus psychroresistens]QGQ97143.1 2-oxo-4-hydroxy-4-carboxy-5-ureidoimidazoline decarboxylase [Paenibacillus psychroresistens]
MATIQLEVLNESDFNEWQVALGWVFEHSPWVAEKAWIFRPFSSIDQLHQIMLQNVLEASYDQQIQLIRAHPNLATKLQISEISQKEQQGVGLDRLTSEEFAEFTESNDAYMQRFEFPFILAVRGQTKESILASMRERIHHTAEVELAKALNEIRKITLFRLKDLIIE